MIDHGIMLGQRSTIPSASNATASVPLTIAIGAKRPAVDAA
jgi:hypothetical protein